jgi:heme a synthase
MYIENKQLNNQISLWLGFMYLIVSAMIVVGGLTRLTDSGLSITQWQLFTGFLPPFNDSQWNEYFNLYKEIPEFKFQNFEMTLSEFKVIFWWEWAHRFLGRLIGLSFLIPLIYFSLKLNFKKMRDFYVIFLLICIQGFVGWYMVSSGLTERLDVSHFRLSIHLLLAFLILSLILWNYLKLKIFFLYGCKINMIYPMLLLILIFFQICIGAFVSGMDAGKIYNSWPLMGANYFPDDSNYIDLFLIESFSNPSLVQYMHRNLAYLILAFYLLILFKILKNKIKNFSFIIKLIGFLILIQILLGILTLLFGAQIFYASMHQISSIFLVSAVIYFIFINMKTN